MKKSDFIKIGEQRINKSMIVSYFPYINDRVVLKAIDDADAEYIFDGTIEDFEALLFDEAAMTPAIIISRYADTETEEI